MANNIFDKTEKTAVAPSILSADFANMGQEVETITNNLYTQIFTNIFDEISVVPNFIDRNYIKFNNITIIS